MTCLKNKVVLCGELKNKFKKKCRALVIPKELIFL